MTFLDNIRAIHNFYCINTNNLIEYSIFVENAQTMKKTFIFILWSLFSVAVNAQNFNDYFEDKTLRVDYILLVMPLNKKYIWTNCQVFRNGLDASII